MAEKERIVDASALIQDDHNFNKGTDEGRKLLRESLERYGAGRSMLIDKDDRIIAGNKTQELVAELGMKVKIVETDADTIVAVKRKDVSLDSKEGREMALLDNLTTQLNLSWDEKELEETKARVEGFDAGEFGWEPPVLEDTSRQNTPTNNELDVDGFGDKIKMTLEFSIEEHAFIQQALQRDGMTKEQVLLQLLGYGTD